MALPLGSCGMSLVLYCAWRATKDPERVRQHVLGTWAGLLVMTLYAAGSSFGHWRKTHLAEQPIGLFDSLLAGNTAPMVVVGLALAVVFLGATFRRRTGRRNEGGEREGAERRLRVRVAPLFYFAAPSVMGHFTVKYLGDLGTGILLLTFSLVVQLIASPRLPNPVSWSEPS